MSNREYTHITEIMPSDMPDWMWDAIAEGLLARRCMERVAELEAQIAAVKECQRYTVFDALGGCELRTRHNGGLLKRRDVLAALEQSSAEGKRGD